MAKGIDITKKFGARVREWRTALGLSQEAFAGKCGLDRTYISGIERGKRNVSLRNIEIIAKALGTSISELTEGL
ncbi:MAG TPA: helix-turn-helix transcriptional regulator [Gemmataceae bacterium]|jgi:transcriptional regulator with XRE-family HTH domain